MNIELIKRFNDVCGELRESGVFGIMDNRLHVKLPKLKEMENLEIKSRSDNDYPYEVFAIVEGVKIFALAAHEDMKDFPQFKEHRRSILLEQLAVVQAELKEEEASA
jgi:hypothetical protein